MNYRGGGAPENSSLRGKETGFTLAEVLITIGIIGIVAAMTFPALIGHGKKVEASSRLKRFNAIMQQAIMMSEYDNGESVAWVRAGGDQKDENGNRDYEANGKITKDFFTMYLAKYFKYTSIVDGKNAVYDENGEVQTKAKNTTIHLADGSSIVLHNGSCIDIHFDINGDSNPNKAGSDVFLFLICLDDSSRLLHCGSKNKAFCSYYFKYNKDGREKLLEVCKNNAAYCSSLLEYDNWEFKKDYPYKL